MQVNITLMELLILALASFRLTRLIVYDQITEFLRKPFLEEQTEIEDGKEEIYVVPKEHPILGFFGKLLTCHWCTGIWSAIIIFVSFFLYPAVAVPILLILAVAGLAAIIETIVQKLLL